MFEITVKPVYNGHPCLGLRKWPLSKSGRYSEVVVSTGLTVVKLLSTKIIF